MLAHGNDLKNMTVSLGMVHQIGPRTIVRFLPDVVSRLACPGLCSNERMCNFYISRDLLLRCMGESGLGRMLSITRDISLFSYISKSA